MQPPVPVPIFGTGADRPLWEPLDAGHFPRAGAVTPGRGEPAGRSCGGSAGRTGGGAPRRWVSWALSRGRRVLVVVCDLALRSNNRPPRPRLLPLGTQTLHLEKCSRAIQDFLGGGAGGMRVGLKTADRSQKFIGLGLDE